MKIETTKRINLEEVDIKCAIAAYLYAIEQILVNHEDISLYGSDDTAGATITINE